MDMAEAVMYCPECNCRRGEDPCVKCFAIPCVGVCDCCTGSNALTERMDFDDLTDEMQSESVINSNEGASTSARKGLKRAKYSPDCGCISSYKTSITCNYLNFRCPGTSACCNKFNESFENEAFPSKVRRLHSLDSGHLSSSAASCAEKDDDSNSSRNCPHTLRPYFMGANVCAPAPQNTSSHADPLKSSTDAATASTSQFDRRDYRSRYCRNCVCMRRDDPCFKCLKLDFRCIGTCSCCNIEHLSPVKMIADFLNDVDEYEKKHKRKPKSCKSKDTEYNPQSPTMDTTEMQQ